MTLCWHLTVVASSPRRERRGPPPGSPCHRGSSREYLLVSAALCVKDHFDFNWGGLRGGSKRSPAVLSSAAIAAEYSLQIAALVAAAVLPRGGLGGLLNDAKRTVCTSRGDGRQRPSSRLNDSCLSGGPMRLRHGGTVGMLIWACCSFGETAIELSIPNLSWDSERRARGEQWRLQ